jgi:TRAP-type mannitol/chloroaromatic compound transport system permease large subunit
MRTIFRGIMPFLLAELACVALLILFPDLVTWLPRVAGYKVD